MKKRLIFDLDNTLIMWKKEYSKAYINTISKFEDKVDTDFILKVEEVIIDDYDKHFEVLTKENLISFLNSKTNKNYDIEFINALLEELSFCSEQASDEIIDTLEYLNNKYDLVVLTNWFADCQSKRLEKAGILKYFSKVYGPPETKLKPHPDAFYTPIGELSIDECVMIGDNIKVDIEGANKIGLDTIYCDFSNKGNNYNVRTIKKIEDLKDIL